MGASVTHHPAGIPRSGSLLPFQVTSREQVATLLLVSLSFKRVLIQGKISKQVSAMSYVRQIPRHNVTSTWIQRRSRSLKTSGRDFPAAQKCRHPSKVPPPSDAADVNKPSRLHTIEGQAKRSVSTAACQCRSSRRHPRVAKFQRRAAGGSTFSRDSWHGGGISCTWPSSPGDLWPKGK